MHTRVYRIPLDGFIPPHWYACPKPAPGFPMSCVFQRLYRWSMILAESLLFVLLILMELIVGHH